MTSELLFWCRSIQKLEEMNAGIDHKGDEVMTHLGQQWNGLTENSSASSPTNTDIHHNPETGLPRDKPGEVASSTPFKAGSQALPPLSESPVPVSQR